MCAADGEVPSTTHLFIANNHIHFTWGSDREVTTFDGGGSGYTGGLREQRMLPASEGGGALLTLATPTLTNSLVGYAIWVLDGAGAGQYRRVLRANYQQQPTQIIVDRAFVGLDPATSLLQAAPMRGQVIMYRNHIEDTGVLQFYGQAMESIVAEHVHERTDGFISIGTVEGTYSDFDRNCSTTSCNFGVNLQLQFLDNLVKESNHMWTWKQTQSQGEGMDYDWHEMYNEYSFVAVGEPNAWTRLVVALVLEKTRSSLPIGLL